MRAVKTMKKIKLKREKKVTLESLCPDAVYLKKTSKRSYDVWVWVKVRIGNGLMWEAMPYQNILTRAYRERAKKIIRKCKFVYPALHNLDCDLKRRATNAKYQNYARFADWEMK